MRDRLGERRAAQRLIAGLAPLFDRRFGQAGFGEMMRQHFRLRRRALRELISQRLGGATMQRLTAALQQILVSRVLDQRVLEAIFRLRRQAFDQQDVGFGEPFQGLVAAALRPCRRSRSSSG